MPKFSRIIACLSILLAYSVALPRSFSREWTDSTGQFHRVGDFISCDGVEVLLRNESGGSTRIRWEYLSRADQLYIFGLARPATPPSVPADLSNAITAAAAKPVIRLANYQPNATTINPGSANVAASSAATPSTDDERNYDSAAGSRMLRKYIYSGCEGRFNLVGMYGTAAYWFHGSHYLAYLVRDSAREAADPNYFYYLPLFGDSYNTAWALARSPRPYCCDYSVWRFDRGGWQRVGYFCRERPH